MNKKLWLPLAMVGGAMAVSAVPVIHGVRVAQMAHAQENADAQAVQLLSQFLQALQNGNENARVQAVLPLLHHSLLTPDGHDIESSVRAQFRKASTNAVHYATPAKVTRIRAKGTLTIGEGANPEKGRAEDYFVAKKDGAPGLPAPVTIFFPENGAPKILYMGSL